VNENRKFVRRARVIFRQTAMYFDHHPVFFEEVV